MRNGLQHFWPINQALDLGRGVPLRKERNNVRACEGDVNGTSWTAPLTVAYVRNVTFFRPFKPPNDWDHPPTCNYISHFIKFLSLNEQLLHSLWPCQTVFSSPKASILWLSLNLLVWCVWVFWGLLNKVGISSSILQIVVGFNSWMKFQYFNKPNKWF